MGDFFWIFFIVFVAALWGVMAWFSSVLHNSEQYIKLKPKLDDLDNAIARHNKDVAEKNEGLHKERNDLETLWRQRSMGFPWLAEALADYYLLADDRALSHLINKRHPAYSAAEVVREIKNEKRELLKTNKIIGYKINYYEKLFPWLAELIAVSEDDEVLVKMDGQNDDIDNEDKVKNYLTQEEYRSLPSVERNQRALDRYLANRNKTNWQIGRDYEMYVGYLHERDGYVVEYKGIIDGFEDMGRDIIAVKGAEVCIVQCKYWSQGKEIHEKHIFQLFGTTIEYWIKNFRNNQIELFSTAGKSKSFDKFAELLDENKIRPILFTSTTLSEKAKEVAKALSIEVVENKKIGEFPRIKCNVSGRDGEKIYHLPFDQQYDRTIIEKHKGEFRAFTVQEAEDAGFRRAFRHKYRL